MSDDRLIPGPRSDSGQARLPAEPLLDAIDRVTGVATKFKNLPSGTLAIELPDAEYPDYFLNTFAKPRRASVCECERSNEPSISQALHLMNSEEIMSKIRGKHGTARRLARSTTPPRDVIDELYLGTLSRYPTDKERALMLRVFDEAGADRLGAVEDVLWALLNTRGFVYNH